MHQPNVDQLIRTALSARKNAYAPYSGFPVGAAIWTTDGMIFSGCNVENASYSLTICAERVALGHAVAQGHRSFEGIAIAATGVVPPCGACLQVLAEFCEHASIIMCDAEGRQVRTSTLSDMLPDRFER